MVLRWVRYRPVVVRQRVIDFGSKVLRPPAGLDAAHADGSLYSRAGLHYLNDRTRKTEEEFMRAIVSAAIVAVALAFGASFVLEGYQKPVSNAFQTSGVRL